MPISSGRRRPPRPVSVHSASANSNAITGPSLPGPPSGRLPCDRKQQGQPHNQGRATKVAPHNGLCKSDRNSCYHKTIKQTGPGWVSSGSSSSATAGIPQGGFKKSGSVSSFCGRGDPSGPDGAGSESVPITETPRRRNSSSTHSSATSSSARQ
ncbi:hypothetical protein HDE_11740 [Halotydeus destructor]|nr:hypothetical protein HDE_11740 [Halotydeus destructor]